MCGVVAYAAHPGDTWSPPVGSCAITDRFLGEFCSKIYAVFSPRCGRISRVWKCVRKTNVVDRGRGGPRAPWGGAT